MPAFVQTPGCVCLFVCLFFATALKYNLMSWKVIPPKVLLLLWIVFASYHVESFFVFPYCGDLKENGSQREHY